MIAGKERLEELVRSIIEPPGIEIVELTLGAFKHTITVKILLDYPHGGITIDECSRINIQLRQRLEEEPVVGDDYTLSVASPGLDRPLRSWRDFRRVTGRRVKVYLSQKWNNRLEFDGKVTGVDEEHLVVLSGDASTSIPIEIINKGMQVIGKV